MGKIIEVSASQLGRIGRVFVEVLREFQAHNGLEAAAALTYFTLLAMVPLLVVSLSVISQFAFSPEAFYDLISQYFFPTPGLRKAILPYLQSFAANTATLSIVGGLFLIITSVSLLTTVEGVFDRVWGVNRTRSLAQKFYSFWTLITLVPFLLAGALFLSSEIMVYPVLGTVLQKPVIAALLGYIVPYVLTFLATFILYRAFSPPGVKFWASIFGSIVVTVLFQIARWGFALYITRYASYRQIYGILWTLPAFFLWIYICWIIFLIGAELSGVIQFNLVGRGQKFGKEYGGYVGLKLVLAVVGAFYRGTGPLPRAELERFMRAHPGILDEMITRLREGKFIEAVAGPELAYLPARSPALIPVMDVISAAHGDPFLIPPKVPENAEDRAIHDLFHQARQSLDRVVGVSLDSLYRASLESAESEEDLTPDLGRS